MQTTKEAESNSINPQNTEANLIKESTEATNQTESKLKEVNLNKENTQTTQQIEKDLNHKEKEAQINTEANTQNKELLQEIAQKEAKLKEIDNKINTLTNKTAKKYYTEQKQALEYEIQQLEMKAGIRQEITKNNNREKREHMQEKDYVFDTKDSRIIFTQDQVKTMQRHIGSIYQPNIIRIKISQMLQYPIKLDLIKYLKSTERHKAIQMENFTNTLRNFNIALKDNDGNILLYKGQNGNKYFSIKGEKQDDVYYIKDNENTTIEGIKEKIQSGAEVLYSNMQSIQAYRKTYNKDESIPYIKVRDTFLQTEKMKEAIPAEYVVIKREHLRPNFVSAEGLQYRSYKQEHVIDEIIHNINVNRLVN